MNTSKINVSAIVIPYEKIRGKATKENDVRWSNFVDSIRHYGNLEPVVVRIGKDGEKLRAETHIDETSKKPIIDEIDVSGKYILVDGLQRTLAAKEISPNFEIAYTLTESKDHYEKSLVANIQRFTMGKGDIARQIKKWINEGKTLSEIQFMINMDQKIILNYLSLNALDSEVLDKVNKGTISLHNALSLVNALKHIDMDDAERKLFTERAEKLNSVDFDAELKALRESKKLQSGDIVLIENREFKPNSFFDKERLEKEYARLKSAKEEAEIDGHDIDIEILYKLELLDYVYHLSEIDVEEQKKAFEAKREEDLRKARLSQKAIQQ